MEKNDLVKGELWDEWRVSPELFDVIFKKHFRGNICFGQMGLSSITDFPTEISAKTKKEAEQILAGKIADSIKSIERREGQINKCKSCKDFTQCFWITLIEVIRNATKT